MKRKEEGIDLVKLYATGNSKAWNKMLNDHLARKDINGLARVKYQIQVGMTQATAKKLSDENMVIWFCRLTRSLEKTAKAIIRLKHPLPGDDPLRAKEHPDWLSVKRKRDQELQDFLKNSSF